MAATRPHLFSATGFLGEEWFVRAYWLYGTDTGAGYGRWASMKSAGSTRVPAGRIMSFDDERIYGYGRAKHASGWTGHRGDSYHLFASVKVYGKAAKGKGAKTFAWARDLPIVVRAMVLTPDRLIVAGVPDLARKDKGGVSFTNPKDGLESLRGGRGGHLSMISRTDGKTLNETKLDSAPIFDGMSVAEDQIYMATLDGVITCFGRGE